jgi:hypothetical protein
MIFTNFSLDTHLCSDKHTLMNPQSSLAGAAAFLSRTSPKSTISTPLLRRQKNGPSLGQSRRRFIGRTVGAAGTMLGASVLLPRLAFAHETENAAPNPIPYGVTVGGVFFHLVFFGPTIAPGVIADFNGFVGVADVQGTGTATYPDGSTETLLYDTDMRFMKGEYVGNDGEVHQGTFEFV